jgi:DNA-binding PadR family transcriptional regulator
MGHKRRGKRHWHKRHNFWHDWHEAQEGVGEKSPQMGPPFKGPPFRSPPPPMVHAWRNFFHNFMGAWPEEHWAFGGRRFSPWHQGIDSFNPFVATLLSKGGGLLPLLVMHLLDQEPRYGNEIMELIAERTQGQWVANPGAIYPLLTMLEEEDLVEGKWADPRKRTMRIYHLTAAGEEELDRLKAIVRPKLEEAAQVLQELARDMNGDEDESPPTTGKAEAAGDETAADDVIYL